MKTYTVITKDFTYRNRHYTIVFDGKWYMTVEHKYIGEDGHLTQELNWSNGLHTSDTLAGCIEDTQRDLDMKHYLKQIHSGWGEDGIRPYGGQLI